MGGAGADPRCQGVHVPPGGEAGRTCCAALVLRAGGNKQRRCAGMARLHVHAVLPAVLACACRCAVFGEWLHSNGFAFNAFCACCSSQVVNEEFEVVKWASERHSVVLPDGLEEGAIGGQGWGGRRAQGGAA